MKRFSLLVAALFVCATSVEACSASAALDKATQNLGTDAYKAARDVAKEDILADTTMPQSGQPLQSAIGTSAL